MGIGTTGLGNNMFKEAIRQIKPALILLILLTLITGLFYPLAVTALAQLFFPNKANGSLIIHQGKLVGSQFIGQFFSSPAYFWGRPSATMPYPYNSEASLGSNSGPTNVNFLATVKARIGQLKKFAAADASLIPVDLVTASGSGLDPEISPAAAYYQVSRIAKARQIPEMQVRELIVKQMKKRTWGILGEPRINVLQLNLTLDSSNLRINNDDTPKS